MHNDTTHFARPFIRLVPLFIAAALVAACSSLPSPEEQAGAPPGGAASGQQQLQQGDYEQAADLFSAAAQHAQQPAKQSTLNLQATLAALLALDTDTASQSHAKVNPDQLNADDRRLYRRAGQLLPIVTQPPAKALKQLPPPAGNTATDIAAYIWQLRASLLFKQYKYVNGIHNLVERGIRLTDKAEIRHNDELIFKRARQAVNLGRGSDSPAAQHTDPTTRGWLRLAEIDKNSSAGSDQQRQALAQWEQHYTGHPATRDVLPKVFDYQPQHTAPYVTETGHKPGSGPLMLALPLSGKLSAPAQALRAGFEMARKRDSETKRRVIVVDSADMSATDIIERARADDAALLIGPLAKDKVAELARLVPRRPILALNEIHKQVAPPSFYRYALAPEDDARTAARHAAQAGWHNAIALVPQGNWGERVLDTFRHAFEQHNGKLVSYATFDTAQVNHKDAVQAVLKPYHRGKPVDFIFMAARPVQARLLHSQIRFYHGAKLPVIATSDIYDGQPDPRKNEDLNGVQFAAMPWVIGTGARLDAARQQAEDFGSTATRRFPKLYAMGIDSWRLTAKLLHDGLTPGTTITGTTGRLEVTPDLRIQRHLAWAKFVDGKATLLEPAIIRPPQPQSSTPTSGQPPADHPQGEKTVKQPQNLRNRSAPPAGPQSMQPEPSHGSGQAEDTNAARSAQKKRAQEIAPLIDLGPDDDNDNGRIIHSDDDGVATPLIH